MLASRIRNVPVSHLELDEVWTFVQKKQRRVYFGDHKTVGNAYCFIALDRSSRLAVMYPLDKSDEQNTAQFMRKVRDATAGDCQISTDAFQPYSPAIDLFLEDRASYARIVKVIGPERIEPLLGLDITETETTYVERLYGTLRQHCKRLTRKTYAFSKCWRMLNAALALFFANYNFCWVHKMLKVSPAMTAGLADHAWSLDYLIEKVAIA